MKRPLLRLWGWPVAISVVTLFGLVAGLLGDGGWDWLAALCLGVPVVLSLWLALRRR